MSRTQMKDIIVVIPGITGSVLRRGKGQIWGPSPGGVWSLLQGGKDLALSTDDPKAPIADDEVRATELIRGVASVPGLMKLGGYGTLMTFVRNAVDVITPGPDPEKPASFLTFPYDWRRDNRASARNLERFVDDQLHRWRNETGNPKAKAILLAHSMGGLVARYYVEVLGGWRKVRLLITFGTPHRGAPEALGYIANGYKKLWIDLTEAMRTFPSVYQLLPIYEIVSINSMYFRVAQSSGIPNLDLDRARLALEFHREIEDAVNANRKQEEYEELTTLPIVGTRHPTPQAAKVAGGKLRLSKELPEGFPSGLSDGDGTVPRISAIPIELGEKSRETFFADRHAVLTSSAEALYQLKERLVHSQTPGLGAIGGPQLSTVPERRPALSVDLDDAYRHDEPVIVNASLVNVNVEPTRVVARIASVPGGAASVYEFEPVSTGWKLGVSRLKPGLYEIDIVAQGLGEQAPEPVRDIFEVAPPEAVTDSNSSQ